MKMEPNNPENVVEMLLWNCSEKGNETNLKEMMKLGEGNYQDWFSLKEIEKHYINIAQNPVGLRVLKVIAANGMGISDNAWPLVSFPVSEKETEFVQYRRECFFKNNEKNSWIAEKDRWLQICKKSESLQFYNCELQTFEPPYEVDVPFKLFHGTVHWMNCVANLKYYINEEQNKEKLQKRFARTEVFIRGCRDEKMLSTVFGDANDLQAIYGIVLGEDGSFYYNPLNESAFCVSAGNRVRMGHGYYPEHEFEKVAAFTKFCGQLEKQYNFYSFYARPDIQTLLDY
ncbi:MAG: hypothetical protein IJT08_02790 [Alphaproteobacteria bacterium]|nr:hypothetical protein [Alphaproteobacteria bacterium]